MCKAEWEKANREKAKREKANREKANRDVPFISISLSGLKESVLRQPSGPWTFPFFRIAQTIVLSADIYLTTKETQLYYRICDVLYSLFFLCPWVYAFQHPIKLNKLDNQTKQTKTLSIHNFCNQSIQTTTQ